MNGWGRVAQALANVAAANTVLASIYGEAVRKAGVASHIVPSLEYRIITTMTSEQWEPVTLQWDQWTDTFDELLSSDAALRELFDHDTPVFIDGVYLWSVFVDSMDLLEPGPGRFNFHGLSSRFRVTPLRSQYVHTT